MAADTVKNRIEAYSGDIGNDTLLSDFISSGVVDVVYNIKRYIPRGLSVLSESVSIATDSGDYLQQALTSHLVDSISAAYLTNSSIDRPAREVSAQRGRISHQDSNSIYAATINDPLYWIEDNIIYMSPGTGTGTFVGIPIPTITLTNAAIPNVPEPYLTQVIRFASMQCLINKLKDNRENAITLFSTASSLLISSGGELATSAIKLDTVYDDMFNDVDGALTNASGLFPEMMKWLVDEDPDMVTSTTGISANEVARANGELADIQHYLAGISQYFESAGKKMEQARGNIENATSYLNAMQEIMASYGAIKMEYDTFWLGKGNPGGQQ